MSNSPIRLSRRGLMFVLSSPSGAGKSTLARLLLSEESDLILSISVTTRQRRASEVDGQHYHFIDEAAFMRMREHGEFLESAEVHGNFYGTPREPVEKALARGQDVLFDIDWQGTEQLAQNAGLASDLVRVFVLPPNFRELRARLERRAEDSSESIRRRLSNARLEIGKWTQYDYVIVNEDLGESYPLARAILRAERARRARVVGLDGFVESLLKQADEALSEAQGQPAGPTAARSPVQPESGDATESPAEGDSAPPDAAPAEASAGIEAEAPEASAAQEAPAAEPGTDEPQTDDAAPEQAAEASEPESGAAEIEAQAAEAESAAAEPEATTESEIAAAEPELAPSEQAAGTPEPAATEAEPESGAAGSEAGAEPDKT